MSDHEDAGETVPLSSARAGDRVTVVRVSQMVEDDAQLLEYLERSGLLPGVELLVEEVSAAAGVLIVTRGDGCPVSIG